MARSSGHGPVDTVAGDIALFSWDEHPALMLGVTIPSHPGSRNTLSRSVYATEAVISSVWLVCRLSF